MGVRFSRRSLHSFMRPQMIRTSPRHQCRRRTWSSLSLSLSLSSLSLSLSPSLSRSPSPLPPPVGTRGSWLVLNEFHTLATQVNGIRSLSVGRTGAGGHATSTRRLTGFLFAPLFVLLCVCVCPFFLSLSLFLYLSSLASDDCSFSRPTNRVHLRWTRPRVSWTMHLNDVNLVQKSKRNGAAGCPI